MLINYKVYISTLSYINRYYIYRSKFARYLLTLINNIICKSRLISSYIQNNLLFKNHYNFNIISLYK